MADRSCFHGRLEIAPSIELMHARSIDCEKAGKIFRSAIAVWQRISRRYGENKLEFWIVLANNPEYPVIASCSRFGVYFNLALWRSNLTPAEDIASRFVEELYHLHEWQVQGIDPEAISLDDRVALSPEELVEYYAEGHEYRALKVLAQMMKITYWKKFLAEVERYRKDKGL
ncbi:MAG: hypothetical protein WD159_00455 [Patescibacteria group bacterium]